MSSVYEAPLYAEAKRNAEIAARKEAEVKAVEAANEKDWENEYALSLQFLDAKDRFDSIKAAQEAAESTGRTKALIRQSASSKELNRRRKAAQAAASIRAYRDSPLSAIMTLQQWSAFHEQSLGELIRSNAKQRKNQTILTSRDKEFNWIRSAGLWNAAVRVPAP